MEWRKLTAVTMIKASKLRAAAEARHALTMKTWIISPGSSFVLLRWFASVEVISGRGPRQFGSSRRVKLATRDMKTNGLRLQRERECVRACTFVHSCTIESAAVGLWSTPVINGVVVMGYIS